MNYLFAQANEITGDSSWWMQLRNSGALKYMFDGGPFMWVILAMGILAAGVIIERYRSLQMLKTDTKALRNRVLELLQADRAEEALELCNREQGPVPAVLSAGLRKYVVLRNLDYDTARTEEQVIKAMEDYGVHILAALERHLPILATIASVAPMVGFLGTVQGMVLSFQEINIQSTQPGVNIIQVSSGGIMIALLTTLFGLIVGIPAFTAYNYFSGVTNRFVLEVEETASELIEAVTLHSTLRDKGLADAAVAVETKG